MVVLLRVLLVHDIYTVFTYKQRGLLFYFVLLYYIFIFIFTYKQREPKGQEGVVVYTLVL